MTTASPSLTWALGCTETAVRGAHAVAAARTRVRVGRTACADQDALVATLFVCSKRRQVGPRRGLSVSHAWSWPRRLSTRSKQRRECAQTTAASSQRWPPMAVDICLHNQEHSQSYVLLQVPNSPHVRLPPTPGLAGQQFCAGSMHCPAQSTLPAGRNRTLAQSIVSGDVPRA